MKRILIVTLVFFVVAYTSVAQRDVRERVYLHLNSPTLIAGETLRFSAYCLSNLTGNTSPLSKILYVEIVGEDGVVHQQKVALENGKGFGEFFISSFIKTGTYQVLAYTRWMKNFDDVFQTPVVLINPFEEPKQTIDSVLELSIDFFPVGEKLIAETSNVIHARHNAKGQLIGRLTSSDGETITNLSFNSLGWARFSFLPNEGKTYQVITEDSSGNFQFFDLPRITKKGAVLKATNDEDFISIHVQTPDAEVRPAKLSIIDPQGRVSEFDILLNFQNKTSYMLGESAFLVTEVKLPSGETLINQAIENVMPSLQKIGNAGTYPKRHFVSWKQNLAAGSYSISIRKKPTHLETLQAHSTLSVLKNSIAKYVIDPDVYFLQSDPSFYESILVTSQFKNLTYASSLDSVKLLPEHREEILDGYVLNEAKKPVSGKKVSFSIAGDPPQIRTAITREDGTFSVPFQSTVFAKDGYLAPLSLDSSYTVQAGSPFLEKYPEFKYSQVSLDENQIKEVVDRSIRNQIENAFLEIERTSNKNRWSPQIPFTYEYILDNYTRFRTLEETFTEYMPIVSARKNRKSVFKLHSDSRLKLEEPPLLLLDGIPVAADRMIDFSPFKIDKISILPQLFILGSLTHHGAILFETKENSLNHFEFGSQYLKTNVEPVNSKNSYGHPHFVDNPTSKKPDQRDELYWNPNLLVTEDREVVIEFYSSDVLGAFEIIIEGYTKDGAPVSMEGSFLVEDRSN